MFACQMCKYKTGQIRSYNAHLYFHRQTLHRRFICLYFGCQRQFECYRNFKKHLTRSHSESSLSSDCSLQLLKRNQYFCNVVGCDFSTSVRKLFLTHLSKHINNQVILKCPHHDCRTSAIEFTNAATIRSHFYRKHFMVNSVDSFAAELPSVDYNFDDNGDLDESSSNTDSGNEIDCFEETYRDILSTLYLTLQSKYFLSNSALQLIISGLLDLTEVSNKKLARVLCNENISIPADILQNNLFYKFHNSVDGPMRSTFCRKQFYKRNFHFVNPQCINLVNDESSSVMYYIPIRETLKALLSNKTFLNQCLVNYNGLNTKSEITDITDGLVFKNSKFFKENPNALRLVLYQDAFEICNPLGSSRKVHKLIGVYFQVANIAAHNRSKVDHIQLVALCFEKDVARFGFDKIFDAIIKELSSLENDGVNIALNTTDFITIKAGLLAVVGDNLGSHQIGGFLENFSSNQYFCRYCHITKSDFDRGHLYGFSCRDVESYELNVIINSITGESSKGIKHNSILNRLEHFHVCNPGLPPCLAHDLFEGVVQQDLMLAINYFVENKIFTYEKLNINLHALKFTNEGKHENIPNIKKREKLIGNASENMRLLLILPFALWDIVDTVDRVWQMIILLRKICCLILSVKISVGQIALLQTLLHEYIELRRILFPNNNLLRKHHFIMHYPKLIMQFGPLRYMWTLRFESKHKYFKGIIKHSYNYKNILFSLTEKHQLLQALSVSQENFFVNEKAVSEKSCIFTMESYPDIVGITILNFCNYDDPKFISDSVYFKGTLYKKGMFVGAGQNELGHHLLCYIKYIIINNCYSDVSFYGQRYEIIEYGDTGLHTVSKKYEEPMCIPYSTISPYEPLLYFISPSKEELFSFKAEPYTDL